MKSSSRRAFYDCAAYPELAQVKALYLTIRDEARVVLSSLGHLLGGQASTSYIMPLVPEAEDRDVYPEELYRRAHELAPTTVKTVGSIPYVIAYAFSRLAPGKHIPEHDHWNPHLVAILCLQGGEKSHIIVSGQRHDFRDGELMIFDYTLPHESKNDGDEERIVLLMVMDPKRARASSRPAAQVL